MIQKKTTHTYGSTTYEAFQPDILSFYEAIRYDHTLVAQLVRAEANLAVLQQMLSEDPFLVKASKLLTLHDNLSSSAIDGGVTGMEDYGALCLADDLAANEKTQPIHACMQLQMDFYNKPSVRRSPITTSSIEDIYAHMVGFATSGDTADLKVRSTQIWIGKGELDSAIYIPPHPTELRALLTHGCAFLEEKYEISSLLACGIFYAHLFLSLPFVSANAKLVRTMLPILIGKFYPLETPAVPYSYFISKHLKQYNEALQCIYREGNISTWLEIFVEILGESTKYSIKKLIKIREIYESACENMETVSRSSKHLLPLFNALFNSPVIDSKKAMYYTKLTKPNANQLIDTCIDLGILKEITNGKRNRKYVCPELLSLFEI